jgi:hypothetical protein
LWRTELKALTQIEADVVYQLLNSTPKLWTPDAAEKRVMTRLAKAGLLIERCRGQLLVTDTLFDRFRAMVLGMRADNQMLSGDDPAVLCAIRAEPEYRFVGSERKMANRMMREGSLRPARMPGRFLVTFQAYTRYNWDTVKRQPPRSRLH